MLKYLILIIVFAAAASAYETVYAVTYGKDEVNHTDSLGVFFTHTNKDCTKPSSGYLDPDTKDLQKQDVPLYQECCIKFRNDLTTLPLAGAGRYLLVLKFKSNLQNVRAKILLNKEYYIHNLDSSSLSVVNHFDVTTVFTVCGDRMIRHTDVSTIVNNTIDLEFELKGDAIPLAAIGLFKDVNGTGLPGSLATNKLPFNTYWDQEFIFSDNCQIVSKSSQVASTATNNYYTYKIQL